MKAPILVGQRVRLEPLDRRHGPELATAADRERSTYGFTTVPSAATIDDYIANHLARTAAGETVPFAQIRRRDVRAIGVTSYLNLRPWPNGDGLAAVEIGATWLSSEVQRTGFNRESKLLLMTHAFETLGVARVDFKTDARNERSRKALAGIGATFEGVLRSWQGSHATGEEGKLRDTAYFSVIRADWPGVRDRLTAGLAASD